MTHWWRRGYRILSHAIHYLERQDDTYVRWSIDVYQPEDRQELMARIAARDLLRRLMRFV